MNNQELLITGGTGSLAKALIEILITKYKPKGIRIFSRDEHKQWEAKNLFKDSKIPIAFIIGDVRSISSLKRACRGVNIIIHTAAMKQIDMCEDNPMEALQTNVDGARNVIEAAIFNNVEKVMNVSTDKGVAPSNLYGASKMIAEKLFENASVYTDGKNTKFASCRYGNVLGSRGSVIHAFRRQMKEHGKIFINHKDMTRFFIELEDVAQFLLNRVMDMDSGSIYIPAMKTISIQTLAKIMYPDCEIEYTGVRHGEKMHELLMSKEESINTGLWTERIEGDKPGRYFYAISKNCKNTFDYQISSDDPNLKFTETEIKDMISDI